MRGGAIPLVAWALVLAVLYGINVVWTGRGIDAAMAGFAVAATLAFAIGFLFLRPREALRRGDPETSEEPQAISSASYGSVLLAVGAAALLYGFAFGHFLVYFGAGVMVVAVGIILREKVAQRRALARWREEDRR